MECTYTQIFAEPKDPSWYCANLATTACQQEQTFVNFFRLYWCDLEGNTVVLVTLLLFFLIAIFKYTSITVEEYIAEGIQNITDWLGVSESIAAVAGLGASYSASYILTALVATSRSDSLDSTFGMVLGAGAFFLVFVISVETILGHRNILAAQSFVFRELSFHSAAFGLIVYLGILGHYTWWGSVILLLACFVYLALASGDIKRNKVGQAHLSRAVELKDMPDRSKPDRQDLEQLESRDQKRELQSSLLEENIDAPDPCLNRCEPQRLNSEAMSVPMTPKAVSIEIKPQNASSSEASVDDFCLAKAITDKFSYLRRQRTTSEKVVSGIDGFTNILGSPFQVVLWLTVLPSQKETYTRTRVSYYPITGAVFVAWFVLREASSRVLTIGGAAGLVLYFLLSQYLPSKEKQLPTWYPAIPVASLAVSFLWLYVLASLALDATACLRILFNLDQSYLGLTVLAIGNALPDALTTITLCKQGAGTMALSAGHSVQLVAFLLTLGISMLKMTIKHGAIPFSLVDYHKFNANLQMIFNYLGLASILGSTLLLTLACRFIITKWLAHYLLLIYLILVVGATYIAWVKPTLF
jgi:sodium/potassium/calcium exchanger 6